MKPNALELLAAVICALATGEYMYWGVSAEFEAGHTGYAPVSDLAFVGVMALAGGAFAFLIVRTLRWLFWR